MQVREKRLTCSALLIAERTIIAKAFCSNAWESKAGHVTIHILDLQRMPNSQSLTVSCTQKHEVQLLDNGTIYQSDTCQKRSNDFVVESATDSIIS